jgi:hypothetical protein
VSNKIAVLGWGSLIWDPRPEFDRQVNTWSHGGPLLPVEFCRVSGTRGNALTLVIDGSLGTKVETLYAISKRSDLNDVVADLRRREGTSAENIGYINAITGNERGHDARTIDVIRDWAETKGIQAVAWTDLQSNFPEREPSIFLEAALKHLKSLKPDGIQKAVEYILKAPPQITTRLRAFIMSDDWFKERVTEAQDASAL